ncbi:MAG: GatB/YqeY domain-containing protein [Alphaproteobacteria bacterium]|nr:GatB/YqeY domain-containing protein [Alphaproteobacteria bacterium]
MTASALRTAFSDSLKTAMKSGEQRRVATVRLILAALKDRDIAHRDTGSRDGIGDEDVMRLLQSMVRQRRDSIALYERGGRLDLAEQEREEIAIIEGFLPRQMDEAAVAAAVAAAIAEVGAKGLRDTGKVMGALKVKFAGQMDFARAGELVRAKLKD